MPPKSTPDRKSGAWSPEERARLRYIVKHKWLVRPEIQMQAQREGVNINAAIGVQWSQVAQEHGTRNSKQCRERWDNHERDDLDRDPIKRGTTVGNWIENYMRERGNKWAEIGRLVNRPENQVKNFGFQVLKAQSKEKTAKDNETAEATHREAAQQSRTTSVSSVPSLASDHGSPLDPKSPYTTDSYYLSSLHMLNSPRAYMGHPMELPPMMHSIRPISSDGSYNHSALTTPTLDHSRPCSDRSSPASLFTPTSSSSHALVGTPIFSPAALLSQADNGQALGQDPLWELAESVIDRLNGQTPEQRVLMKKNRRAHSRQQERRPRISFGHDNLSQQEADLKWVADKRATYTNYFETVCHP